MTQQPLAGGSRPEDVFLRIELGLDGTAMPAFGVSLRDEEIWALACFVRSIAPAPAGSASAPPASRTK